LVILFEIDMRDMDCDGEPWDDKVDETWVSATRGELQQCEMVIIQQIAMSEFGSLSMIELEHYSFETTLSIYCRVQSLVETDYIKPINPSLPIPSDMPFTFYTLTEKSIYVLDCMDAWEYIRERGECDDTVQKPQYIQEIESWDSRPKPEWMFNYEM